MNSAENGHGRYDDLVDRAIDGDLTDEERRELDRHLDECEPCAGLLRSIEGTARAWREAPDEQLPDSVRDAVGERLMAEIAGKDLAEPRAAEPGKVSWLRVALVAVPLAAAAAIALVIAWPDPPEAPDPGAPKLTDGVDTGADTGTSPPPTPAVELASPTRLAGRSTVTSPGGKPEPITGDSRVRAGDVVSLDEGAEIDLELPRIATLHLAGGAVAQLDRSDTGTTVDLRRGMLAALVEPTDPDQVFTVGTPAGLVEVAGTMFSVQVASTAEVRVEVVEGKVVVRDRADDRNVVAVEAGRAMSLDWSDVELETLAREREREIRALFGAEQPDEVRHETAAETTSGPVLGKWEQLFAEAQQLRKDKRLTEALAIYARIAEQAPGKAVRAEASFTMGQARYLSGDPAGAARDLERHLELHGKSPYHEMALYYLAKSRMKLGRFGAALESLRALTAAHPKGARAAEAHYYTGTILASRMNDCPAAIRSLDRFLAMAPKHKLAAKARELRDRCAGAAGE